MTASEAVASSLPGAPRPGWDRDWAERCDDRVQGDGFNDRVDRDRFDPVNRVLQHEKLAQASARFRAAASDSMARRRC